MDFSLYRVKVFKATQREIFGPDLSPPDILRRAILERPTSRYLRGEWHIGNVEQIDDAGVYFAFGRTSRTKVPIIDPKSGDFVETESDSAPYTHVVVDIPLELVAVAHRTSLAPHPAAIARQLERLLNRTRIAEELKATITVTVISEPEEFLSELRTAYAITSFTIYFTRPNVIDVEEDYLRPMEKLAQEANGNAGNTTIKGPALDPEPLTALTRSAAATGDNATARLRLREGGRPVRRSLKGDSARIAQDEIDSTEEKRSFLDRLRAKYHQIRGDGRETA